MTRQATRTPLALGLTTLCLAASTASAQQVEETWVAKYDGVPTLGISSIDYVKGLEVRDGHVYLTGYEDPFATNSKYATVKYDYSGQEQWVQRVSGGQAQIAEALAVDAAGNVYVTGWQKQFGAGIDALTLKYDSDGAVLWQRLFSDAGGNVQPNDMALDASGNLYVAGATWVPAQQDFDLLLIKYDPAGNLLWSRTLDNGDGQLDSAYQIAIDPDGNAILAGYTEPNPYLVKYSPTGDLLWEDEHVGFSTNDEWRRVETDAAGNIYVLGEISPPGEPNHLWTAKYDPAGNLLWEDNYTGSASTSCYAGGLAIMPDGGAVISGTSADEPFSRIATIRYAPDGTKLWQRFENAGYLIGIGGGGLETVAVDAEGQIYTTGYGYNVSFQEDIITLSYSAQGDLLWTRIFADPDPAATDVPHAIAVDGAGSVFVAAHSWSGATSNDFTVIRYREDPLVNYCTAGTSASGCQATLTASGLASATAPTGFQVSASTVEGNKDGLFFYGSNGRQANAWGNGSSFQCVVPPTRRSELQSGTGSEGRCDGSATFDLNSRWTAKPGQNPGPGAVVDLQFWYRDPSSTSSLSTSLSDAIEFTVDP